MRRRERRGSIVVLVAVLMVVLLGFGAFAVDVAQMQAYKSELKRTADAAALAATQELLSNPPNAPATAAAYVAMNPVMGTTADSVEYTYGIWNGAFFQALPPAAAATANAFRVSVRSSGDFYLAQLIGGRDFDVNATATAWLPISVTPCVKPWAILESAMSSQLPTWPTIPFDTLRGMSDASSGKVFTLKGNVSGGFSGVVNLPVYFDATLGVTYPGPYDETTYEQSIWSGCPSATIDDTLQTKIGPYDPETAAGILGSAPGSTPVCSFLSSTVCHNLGGQMGVAVRIAVIEDPVVLTTGCGVDPIDPDDDYGPLGSPQVLCGRVTDVVTFVFTRAIINAGQTTVIGSYAGHDDTGPVNGFAQRPILVQ